jgi:effector-binding domain-containing protein
VRACGAKETGPGLALWHQGAEVLENEDAEAVVPIERTVAGNERVNVYELDGGRVASVIHEGDYANFNQAHAALLSWMETNGYRTAGPIREVYVRSAEQGMNAAVTEIQYPVKKA